MHPVLFPARLDTHFHVSAHDRNPPVMPRAQWLHLLWLRCASCPSLIRRACLPTWGLIVERDHLAASVPENLRHVIAGIHSASLRVDPTHLPLIVAVLFVKEKAITEQPSFATHNYPTRFHHKNIAGTGNCLLGGEP